ncbi:MAG: alpha/beta hydrolase [Anaerolineae bacterium]
MQFPEQITIGLLFSLFAYGAILGASQIVAARHRLVGLSLLGVRNPLRGYLLGSTLLLLAYGWFFGTKGYEIFSPGPASSEFAFFLGLAFSAALSTALLIPNLTRRPPVLKVSHPQVSLEQGILILTGSRGTGSHGRGTLYLPKGSTLAGVAGQGHALPAPRAAICALPGLGEGTRSLEPLATHLAERGFVVLVLELSTLEYPDLLALIPSGVAYLAAHPEVDPQRIGVLGVDLGADLAIRSASGDEQVRAVAALSPILETTKPGLHILAEMPYLQGMRWARATKELVSQIAALEHLPQGRPYLLLCGGGDRLAPQDRLPPGLASTPGLLRARTGGAGWHAAGQGRTASEGEEMVTIEGEKRFSLPRSPAAISLTADWFRERLGG